ncbi:MAG: flagellar basal body-associated FliL family protein [Bacteriovorax sp.]|nr:flagellar basal body-associated FliL family protein [Bacteriovorax sp.]
MTGKKLLDMILLGVMTLTTLAVIGLFYYTEKMYKRPPIDESREKEALLKEGNPKALPAFFKLEKMTVSLVPKDNSGIQRMRYVELEIHLVLFKSDDAGIIKTYLSVVQDKIITVASKMGADELNSLTGKILLEDRLKKEINKSLGKPVVKSIFFSRYIVQ